MGNDRYVRSACSIYTDPDIEEWEALTIYFFEYLWRNDHVHGVTGIGEIARRVIIAESRMDGRQIADALKQIGDKVRWFEKTYWVVPRAGHTCYTQSGTLHPKFAICAKHFATACCDELREAFTKRYPDIMGLPSRPIAKPSAIDPQLIADTSANGVDRPNSNSDINSDSNSDINSDSDSDTNSDSDSDTNSETGSTEGDCADAHRASAQLADMPLFRDDPKFAEAWVSWFKASLVTAYPHLGIGGILYEMRQAHAYAKGKAAKGKPYQDFVAFVRGWIKRSYEPKAETTKAGDGPKPQRKPKLSAIERKARELASLDKIPESEWSREDRIALASRRRDLEEAAAKGKEATRGE